MSPTKPEPPRPSPTHPPSVAQRLLQFLSEAGLRHVFMVPGLQIDPLNQALATHNTLRGVIANHELAAGYMADGYARASGRPGVVFAIGGPGCANLMGAAVAARADRSPVLFVTGNIPLAAQKPSAFQDGGPWGANDAGLAAAALAERVVCTSVTPWAGCLHRVAQRLARNEPVHLQLAHDVQQRPAPETALALAPSVAGAEAEVPPWPSDLLAHGRIVLFADAGALAVADAVALAAQRYGLPVVTDLAARGLVDEDSPWSAGHLGFMPHPAAQALLAAGSPLRAQQVLHIGEPHGSLPAWFSHDQVQRIGPAPFAAWLRGPTTSASEATLADRRQWLEAAATRQRPPPGAALPDELTHARAVDVLVSQSDPRTAWVIDAGQVRRIAVARLRCHRPRSLFVAEGMAPMGWSLGAAVGVALAQPQHPVVVLLGDGAMRMHGIEIATAARYRLPIVYVLFDNQAYGSVLQRMATPLEREQAQLPPVNWAAFAQAFGVACQMADDVSGLQRVLGPLLARAASCTAPQLLVLRVPAVDPDAFDQATGLEWPRSGPGAPVR